MGNRVLFQRNIYLKGVGFIAFQAAKPLNKTTWGQQKDQLFQKRFS
ncbi:MAG: hypothetical protein OXD29_03450 [Roseovarius sp.]|nr:hypothetical protein [Roseovarius sp.]MCY4206992.1 hypothetical protein [Roseovarius sp.]